jgi:hypothetical protein
MSQDRNHLNHATWECKYHVAFTLKYRKKLLFGQNRRHLGTVRGDDPHLHQKSGDRGQAVGSVATQARVLIKSRLLYQNPS